MIPRNKSLVAIAAIIVIAALALFTDWVDWHGLRQSLESMDRGPLLALVAVLPIFGFSIAAVYLVVGAVFGGWLGLAVVAGITSVHLLGSHWIGRRMLRGPVRRFLERRKRRLPEVPDGEEWAVALTTALVPGLPYFVRNYLLAVSDIPLRTYFWICAPVYVLRSSAVIFLGDLTGDLSARRLLILGLVLVAKLAVCAYLIHRLRVRYKARSGAVATAFPR